jgi:hypothetical protein
LEQTYRADEIILWLAASQFPDKEKDLPEDLLDLVPRGLTICWYKYDIKSYKKLVPTLRKYPNDIIVTVDDDIIYDHRFLEILNDSHLKKPQCIIAHRITRVYVKNNKFFIVPRDLYYQHNAYDYIDDLKNPSYFNKLTGCAGVLYPPGSLHPDVLSEEIFMKLAPTSDDIWFWLMGVRNHVRVFIPDNHIEKIDEIEEAQKESLSAINDHGEKLFFTHLYNITTYYPDLLQIMDMDSEVNNKLIKMLKGNITCQIKRIFKKVSIANFLKHLRQSIF